MRDCQWNEHGSDQGCIVRIPEHVPDPNLFDMAHRTCALYVAVHSAAWQRPMAFGNDVDADDVRWNMCPGGTMVACAVAPDANGDSVRTGIPWPYPPPATH